VTNPSEWTLGARWIFPADRAPLEQGTLTLQAERIVAVEPHGRRTPDVDLGDVALLPGLVNAHTHLDLSGLRGLTPPGEEFTDWLRAVIQHRRRQSPDQIAQDIQSGLAETLASGTTLVGDISAQGASWTALSAAPLRAVVFYELLGLSRTRAHQAWAAACAWIHLHPATLTCRSGLSPHAPYSVRAALFRAADNMAALHELVLATHWSETQAELSLLQRRTGPFVDFLKDLGVWDPHGLVEGPEQVMRLLSKAANVLAVHGNYLNPDRPIPSNTTIVYCPRTHAAFGHAPHPFRALLAQGVNVALGTDSLASNPDLSVRAEARLLHEQFPDVPGAMLLKMATLNGARALGWQDETGSLDAGKSADFIVLRLPHDSPPDPHELLFTSAGSVQAVYFRGRQVYEAP
jgi:cytosine/adenosine deaminase-related metal-dependent hydrolase